jgi:replicative DNA helicase
MTRPWSLRAEQTVLGFAMIHPEWMPVLMGIVSDQDYFEDRHRWYHCGLARLGEKFTTERLRNYLRERGAPPQHNDMAYVASLFDVPRLIAYGGEEDARKNAEDVRRYARLRRLINVAKAVAIESGTKGWMPDDDWLNKKEATVIGAIRDARCEKRSITLAEQVPLCIKAAEDACLPDDPDNPKMIVKTGFHAIDNIIGGLHGGDLVIIAGRPSMGKSALAIAMAWQRGEATKPVHVFSAEMSPKQIGDRMLSAKARVDGHRLRNGTLTDDNWGRLIDGATRLVDGTPMIFTDCTGKSIASVSSDARVTAASKGIGLVVVDYIQLLRGTGNSRYTNREREIAQISGGLKALAKELDIPVIALSQLNRELEKRDDKRPKISDLRESGAIEQDADTVMFLYRDEVYNKDTSWVGVAEVNVAKNRTGRIGRARLRWTPEFTRFDDYEGVDR